MSEYVMFPILIIVCFIALAFAVNDKNTNKRIKKDFEQCMYIYNDREHCIKEYEKDKK